VSAASPIARISRVQWTVSRVLALLVFVGVAAVLGWFVVDERFYVYAADVQGNSMLGAAEVYQASGLDGMSAFFVDRDEVAERICQAIPGVTSVQVDCRWPSQVSIVIREQDVRFAWHAQSGAVFLVDGAGLVLKMDAGPHPELLAIRELDAVEVAPGAHVNRVALNTASGLHALLSQARVFEYSRSKGIQWMDESGRRVIFGDNQDLDKKVACMRALIDRIEANGSEVEFIDVRFVESPYYR